MWLFSFQYIARVLCCCCCWLFSQFRFVHLCTCTSGEYCDQRTVVTSYFFHVFRLAGESYFHYKHIKIVVCFFLLLSFILLKTCDRETNTVRVMLDTNWKLALNAKAMQSSQSSQSSPGSAHFTSPLSISTNIYKMKIKTRRSKTKRNIDWKQSTMWSLVKHKTDDFAAASTQMFCIFNELWARASADRAHSSCVSVFDLLIAIYLSDMKCVHTLN